MEADLQKSYFEVLGICCPSETPLIEKILKPLDGVHKVSVSVPTKTVIVVHNNLLISQEQIVKALNQARLDASIRSYGGKSGGRRNWPNWYTVGSGILLIVSFFKTFYRPLHWLALAAVIVGLPPVLLRAYAAVRRLVLDINMLMLIAVGGAIALGDYQEAGTIVFLFTFAEWLESRAGDKARDMMSSLMKEMPQKATIADTGEVVHPNEVKINTVLIVKAGEVIPIDGVVVNGRSEVDEKSLTGESYPVEKSVGSLVWAGTMNLTGYIDIKTTALAEDSAVAKMTKLVEEAHQNRSRTQRIVDEFAKYYTPIVLVASVCIAVVPAILRVNNVHHWVYLSLVVLVSACPCALVLSTPVATECALRRAASIGLLIKGGDHLESLARAKFLAFDKTGTLTRGKFVVSHFRPTPGFPTNQLLYWVASLESKSSHPMACALVEYSRLSNIEPSSEAVRDFQVLPGEGISGEIDGRNICIGNKRMTNRLGCKVMDEGDDEKKKGVTMGYVVVDGTLAGTLGVCDECRPGAKQVIQKLKSMGIKTAMLTGDSRVAASHIQEQLGNSLDFIHAELLPENKVSIVEDLKKQGPTVMVGDGMNDAPALAGATVGIAMGVSGSAIATETSHITLMSNDIGKIAVAIKLGRRTQMKIIQNIVLSVTTKGAILGLAFAGHPRLWAAVLADVGTCVLVILNSMLLLRGNSHLGNSSSNKGHKHHSHKSCGGHGHGHDHDHNHDHDHGCKSKCSSKKQEKSHTHKACKPCGGAGDKHEMKPQSSCKVDHCGAPTMQPGHRHDHGHGHAHEHGHEHMHGCKTVCSSKTREEPHAHKVCEHPCGAGHEHEIKPQGSCKPDHCCSPAKPMGLDHGHEHQCKTICSSITHESHGKVQTCGTEHRHEIEFHDLEQGHDSTMHDTLCENSLHLAAPCIGASNNDESCHSHTHHHHHHHDCEEAVPCEHSVPHDHDTCEEPHAVTCDHAHHAECMEAAVEDACEHSHHHEGCREAVGVDACEHSHHHEGCMDAAGVDACEHSHHHIGGCMGASGVDACEHSQHHEGCMEAAGIDVCEHSHHEGCMDAHSHSHEDAEHARHEVHHSDTCEHGHAEKHDHEAREHHDDSTCTHSHTSKCAKGAIVDEGSGEIKIQIEPDVITHCNEQIKCYKAARACTSKATCIQQRNAHLNCRSGVRRSGSCCRSYCGPREGMMCMHARPFLTEIVSE